MMTADYFKALGDDTRLRLVNLLAHHELNVNEIVEILNMGQSRISRHLRILTDQSLLTFRRDGLWSFYSVPSQGPGAEFINAIRYLFKQEKVYPEDLVAAQQVIEKRSRETTCSTSLSRSNNAALFLPKRPLPPMIRIFICRTLYPSL